MSRAMVGAMIPLYMASSGRWLLELRYCIYLLLESLATHLLTFRRICFVSHHMY
jgi:hypothetical protein